MGFEALGPGEKAPNEFYVVIEIPAYGPPVKYEVDKETGLLMVDRFMNVAMSYPANYGYVPKTLAGDAKLLAVPVDKVSNGAYPQLNDLADVPERVKNEIHHFYSSYKALEKGKWVKITGWRDAAAARGEITAGIAAYKG